MIRRDAGATGAPTQWTLISQIDHATLAGQLAEHWGAAPFLPLVPRESLLWAIYHHDDGWRHWETAPDAEPKHGRPRSFTEMEIEDSLVIWSGSIAIAAEAGHLEAYVVAGHFSALARRTAAWKSHDPNWSRVERFLVDNDRLMQSSLAAWQGIDPANTAETAQRALSQLQFFDSLSLWFCCAAATEPDTVDPPGGPRLTLTPVSETQVRFSPWPLAVPATNLEIRGRVVPMSRYRGREALAAVPFQTVQLDWRLEPDPDSAGK
jgi:hypothetical protein